MYRPPVRSASIRPDLYTSPNILRVILSPEEIGVRGMGHLWETGELRTRFWWGNLREGDHLEDLGVDGRKILKRILQKRYGEALSQFIWLRMGTGGGHL